MCRGDSNIPLTVVICVLACVVLGQAMYRFGGTITSFLPARFMVWPPPFSPPVAFTIASDSERETGLDLQDDAQDKTIHSVLTEDASLETALPTAAFT